MPNRIKDMFSNDMFNISGHLRFKNNDAYKSFLAALDAVQEDGRSVAIDGVISITTEINHQGTKYPLEEHTMVSQFVVGPSFEPFTFPLKVGETEQEITLWRNVAKRQIVIRSDDSSIIFFQFVFFPNENKHTMTYKIQYEKAASLEEVADSFRVADAFLSKLFLVEDSYAAEKGTVSVQDVKNYFRFQEAFLRRLLAVKDELNLSFSPEKLKDLTRKQQQDIDELYVLLILHKTVKLDGKLESTESTTITLTGGTSSSVIGSNIDMTFLSTVDFDFPDNPVKLYSANLLTNAIVKNVTIASDGVTKIYYGDTDSKPMYISFSAFKKEEEASSEVRSIMEHKDNYTKATSLNSYVNQFYS